MNSIFSSCFNCFYYIFARYCDLYIHSVRPQKLLTIMCQELSHLILGHNLCSNFFLSCREPSLSRFQVKFRMSEKSWKSSPLDSKKVDSKSRSDKVKANRSLASDMSQPPAPVLGKSNEKHRKSPEKSLKGMTPVALQGLR